MLKNKELELSIIIVNWNCGQVIVDCLESLIKTIHKTSYEIIVVDNDSKDGSVEKIIKDYPQVRVLRNEFNNMFAGANNQGYKISKGEYILILNADTVVTENAVDGLVGILANSNENAVTCTLLNKDGTIQRNMHRGFPSVIRLASSALYGKFSFFKFFPSVRNYLYLDKKFDKDFYVEQAPGAVILLKRKLIEDLGYLFDERNFPLFFNDVDLCYRINKIGVKILCKTDIKIYHLKGYSVKKLPKKNYALIHTESFLKFTKKHKLYADYYLTDIIYNILKKI